MEHFVIIVNGFQPLTIITKSSTKSSILDIATVLDPPPQMKPVSLEGESPTLNYENMSKIFQVAAIPITKQKG